MIEQNTLKLSPGNQKLSPIFVKDTTRAIIHCTNLIQKQKLKDIYSINGPETLTLKRISTIIENANNQIIPVEWGAFPYRKNQIMDPFITERLPGWLLEMRFTDGVYELIK